MRHSDAWVAAGCPVDDPLLAAELDELESSYRSLLAAVARPQPSSSST